MLERNPRAGTGNTVGRGGFPIIVANLSTQAELIFSMSIDTADEFDLSKLNGMTESDSEILWESLRARVKADNKRIVTPSDIFGEAATQGSVYRWGVAAARGGACDEFEELLSRLACGARIGKKRKRTLAVSDHVEQLIDRLSGTADLSTLDATMALTCGAAMPALMNHLDRHQWWRLLTTLEQTREAVLQRSWADEPAHLILGGELGLTLAWKLPQLPVCQKMSASSGEAVKKWLEQDHVSLTSAVRNGTHARAVMASVIRCEQLLNNTTKIKLRQSHQEVAATLATWVAAMTTHTGATAFSDATRKQLADDLRADGLLDQMVKYDAEALEPAVTAALGMSHSGGRLAWQVSLPEAIHHDPDAKLAILFPDWDVRRGRTHLDYSADETNIELFAGRSQVISGNWETQIELDGKSQQARGEWTEVCEYTDDDVHYLELEQVWSGGILVQRQILQVRDDRCVLLADAVLPNGETANSNLDIKYTSRLPLHSSIQVQPEDETRELYVSDGQPRGLVIPLAASEWQVGPTDSTLHSTDDRHLALSVTGKGRLYAPLWFDFQQRRFKRKRTWRQLTVADELRIVDAGEAVGYRIQLGSEQWMVYRSLAERRCRTVLGKHLIADFFCSRFDPSDGSHEELVTVDDSDSEDDG